MKSPGDVEHLRDAVARADRDSIGRILSGMHPSDAARLVSHLLRREQKALLLLLSPAKAADVVEDLPDVDAAEVVAELSAAEAAPIVREMSSDQKADLLQELPAEQVDPILRGMPAGEASRARELMSYPADTAGGLMQTEFVAFPHVQTVDEVLAGLRARATEIAALPVSYVYVLDEGGRLAGVVRLRDLLLAASGASLDSVMVREPIHVRVDCDRRTLVQRFEQYRLMALPVVDADGRLIGVVTEETAIRAAGAEAGTLMLRLSGILGGEERRDMPLHRRSTRRLAWLTLNIGLNIVSASVVAAYQETLRQAIALAVFLPIVSDMSGCSGGQAAAVSIRELTLGRASAGRLLWVLRREFAVGLINGAILGALIGLVGFAWKGNPWLGLVAGLALAANTTLSVLVGGTVPILLHRRGWDPAAGTAPILTTVTDVAGFFAVLSLGSLFLSRLSGF